MSVEVRLQTTSKPDVSSLNCLFDFVSFVRKKKEKGQGEPKILIFILMSKTENVLKFSSYSQSIHLYCIINT